MQLYRSQTALDFSKQCQFIILYSNLKRLASLDLTLSCFFKKQNNNQIYAKLNKLYKERPNMSEKYPNSIFRVSVILDIRLNDDMKLKKNNIMYSHENEHNTVITKYCLGMNDKTAFISYIRNKYSQYYNGYDSYIIPLSDRLQNIITKGLS